jgi:hypothetical protein
MSAASLVPLLERFESVSFQAARAVQAEGLADECWFVIESGQVALHACPDDPSSDPVLLGPGDGFGARALLGRALPLAVALADTDCLSLPRAAFYGPLDGGASASQQTSHKQVGPPPRPLVWVGQQEAADCGVAALVMVARYRGLVVSPEGLRRRLPVGPAGVSLLALQDAASSLGFRSRAVRLGFEQLAGVRLPAIAHLRDGHYVVLYARAPDGVVAGDPAAGIRTLPAATFRQAWSGNLLLALPAEPAS